MTAGCRFPIYSLSGKTSLALDCEAVCADVEASASGVGYERSVLVEAEDPDRANSLGMTGIGLELGDKDIARCLVIDL